MTEDNIWTGENGIFAKTREALLQAIKDAPYLPLGQCSICSYIIKRIECAIGSERYRRSNRGEQVQCPQCNGWSFLI